MFYVFYERMGSVKISRYPTPAKSLKEVMMKNSNRLAQNYFIRKSLFFLLVPLVGIGGYFINTQKNHVRSADDIVLTNLNAVQVKNLATESGRDMTGGSTVVYDGTPNPNPKPRGTV